MKTDIHNKDFALKLILKERPRGTPKWPIRLLTRGCSEVIVDEANNLIVLVEFLLKFTSKIAQVELPFKIKVMCARASAFSII